MIYSQRYTNLCNHFVNNRHICTSLYPPWCLEKSFRRVPSTRSTAKWPISCSLSISLTHCVIYLYSEPMTIFSACLKSCIFMYNSSCFRHSLHICYSVISRVSDSFCTEIFWWLICTFPSHPCWIMEAVCDQTGNLSIRSSSSLCFWTIVLVPHYSWDRIIHVFDVKILVLLLDHSGRWYCYF